MQVRNPRKASTMARRFLETSLPSSQKGKTSHFSPTRRKNSYSHLCLSSSHSSLNSTISASSISVRAPSLPRTHSQHSPSHPSEMSTILITALRTWLTENDLQGFIQVAEAPPYPNTTEIASKLNIETITDSMIRKKLSLDSICLPLLIPRIICNFEVETSEEFGLPSLTSI